MVEAHDSSGFHESVRTLRNSILLANLDRRYRSLLVTSAAPAEGKTTTAANLAAAHAEQGQRTLLIDGDLRRPSVHRNFNLPGVVGLANVLRGDLHWRAAVIPVEGLPDLHVLPAGAPSRHAAERIGRGLAEIVEEAAADYDLVVVDAPPLLGFAEPLQMATAVDGVLVVARAGQTTRKAVAAVLATLNRVRANTVGLVLNEVHRELSDSYYYYDTIASYYRTPAGGAQLRKTGYRRERGAGCARRAQRFGGAAAGRPHRPGAARRTAHAGQKPGRRAGRRGPHGSGCWPTAALCPQAPPAVALNGRYMNYRQWRAGDDPARLRALFEPGLAPEAAFKNSAVDRAYQRRRAAERAEHLGAIGLSGVQLAPVEHHQAHAAAAYYTSPYLRRAD